MATRGVIVRRLEAIENLGSMDILCTDKTGTLTEGVVTLDAALDAQGRAAVEVGSLAHLNAASRPASTIPSTPRSSPRARDGLATAGWRKVDEIPYDFIRRRLTIVVAPEHDAGAHLMITKGAFEEVLAICVTVECDGVARAARCRGPRRPRTALPQHGRGGLPRHRAGAARTIAARARYEREDERDLVFLGFLRFADPPKADARDTIRDLAALGVRIKIITGDNRYVAGHMANAIGLDHGTMLTGEEIAAMRDESLWRLAEDTALFVEVDPQQKERIVRALQHGGHAVGYLGDGINDAPALHAADVGISVDSAVDVARESADIILLRRDLDVLRRGIEDGRHTFANTLKYIQITTSANFGNMVSMALATPLLPFLPLAAKQILLNNFLSDVPSVAISTDHVDRERLASSQRWDVAELRRFMIVFGLLSTVFDLLTFCAAAQGLRDRRGDLPDRLVHRLAPDRARRGLRAAHARPGARQPAERAPRGHVGSGRRGCARLALSRVVLAGVRLRAGLRGTPCAIRAGCRGLHRRDRDRQAVVLPQRAERRRGTLSGGHFTTLLSWP